MAATQCNGALRRSRLHLELLETREVLSVFTPTAVEQAFLEQLNDARANPAAYGASIGLDLSSVAPAQPLAFDPRLIQSARLHSQDMNDRSYFAHITPDGIGPGQRMADAGLAAMNYGESIAGGYPGPSQALSALILDNGIPDLGHRRHLLAIDSAFQSQNVVGIGIVQQGSGPLGNYYTIDTA
ncbi:MAG TPA: CAP domain-containing protein, partial [Gemmataceae bacterium]|nr:CAP domain-containing protein [Gemmataceae bacterium]